MSITKLTEWSDALAKYASDANPTTQQQIISFLQNNNEVLQALARLLWQPQRAAAVGSICWAPSMGANLCAIVSAAGVSGTTEPTWGADGASVADGSITYKMTKWGNDNTAAISAAIDAKENKGACLPLVNNTLTAQASPSNVISMDSNRNIYYSSIAALFALLTKAQVTNALGYTPPQSDTKYTAGDNITLTGTAFSLTSQNVVNALGYTPQGANTSNIPYGICATGRTTNAKAVTLTGAFSLIAGQLVYVKFSNGNTATSPTLNINGTGAKPLKQRYINTYTNSNSVSQGLYNTNEYRLLCYDGTNYNAVDFAIVYHSSENSTGV